MDSYGDISLDLRMIQIWYRKNVIQMGLYRPI